MERLVMQGNRILAVDEWANVRREFSGITLDLGEQVILPGLINAHCHLDYTLMSGKLGKPSFVHFMGAIHDQT
jgi:cytosine/adenosine deaminase-related metal-dependent hydrolase